MHGTSVYHQGRPAKGSPLAAWFGYASLGGRGRRDSEAGGRYPSELCGRMVLYAFRQRPMSTFASRTVSKTSRSSSSSRSLPLKLSAYLSLAELSDDLLRREVLPLWHLLPSLGVPHQRCSL
jgi:hypothetical protein